MPGPLLKPISPLTVWFWFMQLLTGCGLVGYWVEVLGHHNRWLADRRPVAILLAVVFPVSVYLIVRGRRFGYLAAFIGWLLAVVLLLPTV